MEIGRYFSEAVDKNLREEFAKRNIRYTISLGRRQPMHIVHLDCIREIIDFGLVPVIVTGSVNDINSRFYDPIKNPLNLQQIETQIELAMGRFSGDIEYISFAISDYENDDIWAQSIINNMKNRGIKLEHSVFHFRKKQADIGNQDNLIKPLSFYLQLLQNNGLNIWESFNKNIDFDSISSTYFRKLDITNCENQKIMQQQLIEYKWLLEQIHLARSATRGLLDQIPSSMLDLSLIKLSMDRNISVENIISGNNINSMKDLDQIIGQFCYY